MSDRGLRLGRSPGWLERLLAEVGDGFPETIKANRAGMAIHGLFDKPCPDSGSSIQRLRRQDSESEYYPRCQTVVKRCRSISRFC